MRSTVAGILALALAGPILPASSEESTTAGWKTFAFKSDGKTTGQLSLLNVTGEFAGGIAVYEENGTFAYGGLLHGRGGSERTTSVALSLEAVRVEWVEAKRDQDGVDISARLHFDVFPRDGYFVVWFAGHFSMWMFDFVDASTVILDQKTGSRAYFIANADFDGLIRAGFTHPDSELRVGLAMARDVQVENRLVGGTIGPDAGLFIAWLPSGDAVRCPCTFWKFHGEGQYRFEWSGASVGYMADTALAIADVELPSP